MHGLGVAYACAFPRDWPRVLLAKLGLMLMDKKLWREARTYLGLLRQDAAIAQLEAIRKSKRVAF